MLVWADSAQGQCVLAFEGVHGRGDLVGSLLVQLVEVASVVFLPSAPMSRTDSQAPGITYLICARARRK